MQRNRRNDIVAFLVGVLIGTLIIFGVLVAVAHAESADRFLVTGGSEAQRTAAIQALESSLWDWDYGWQAYEKTPMTFVASFPPYWYEDGGSTVLLSEAREGDYLFLDEFGAAVGLARYPSGDTFIRKYYPGSDPISGALLNEVVLHEAAHARVWFPWLKLWPEHWREWTRLCTLGIPDAAVSVSWDTMPAENQAEHHRFAYAVAPQRNDYPRTRLNTFTKEEVRTWHDNVAKEGKPPVPPPPAGSQRVTVNPGPYRSTTDHVTLTGTYEGAGNVWFVPTDEWGSWAVPAQADMKEDGTWSASVYLPWQGPLYISFEVVLYWDDEHQAVHEGHGVFDRTLSPFVDIPTNNGDFELYHSVWYGKQHSLVEGYPDRTFRPGGRLLKRHVWLICSRAQMMGSPIGSPPSSWSSSYTTATRGDVRDTIPGLEFNSTRWDEVLTRSQLLRLILRGALK